MDLGQILNGMFGAALFALVAAIGSRLANKITKRSLLRFFGAATAEEVALADAEAKLATMGLKILQDEVTAIRRTVDTLGEGQARLIEADIKRIRQRLPRPLDP